MQKVVHLGALAALLFLLTSSIPLQAQQPKSDRGRPWKRYTIDDTTRGADGARLADVNGDKLPDIATGFEEGGQVRVSLHPGYKKVRAKWPSVLVGKVKSPEDAVFVDLDNDGALDVVSACEGRTMQMFAHWAPNEPKKYLDPSAWKTQTFPAVAKTTRWMFATPMQIDQKLGLDLVVGSKDPKGQVGWLQAPKQPRLLGDWKYHPVYRAGWIMSLIAADMDGDKDLDVLVSDRRGKDRGCLWLENPGPGPKQTKPWKQRRIGPKGGEVMFVELADLDRDGRQDVIAPHHNHRLFVHWGGKTANEWKTTEIQFPKKTGTGKAVRVADVNLDGKLDIVLACAGANKGSGIVWLSYRKSPHDAVWDVHEISGLLGIKFDLNQLADLDGDGDLDIINTEERTNRGGLGVVWYENPTK
ncbi:MAG: FG-GAP repeat domain-containing protein [Gemmataceae bacterium]